MIKSVKLTPVLSKIKLMKLIYSILSMIKKDIVTLKLNYINSNSQLKK